MQPGLYGIKNSNRDFSNPYYWGKNQFNSSFPVALACYMRDLAETAVYLTLDEKLTIKINHASFNDIFGTELSNQDITFPFESRYEPFGKYVYDELEKIDLVIRNSKNEGIRPLEIKLTTIPDNTTAGRHESEYGAELVIRSATMRYMALSMAHSLESCFADIYQLFETPCSLIRDWDNIHEIKQYRSLIFTALESFFNKYQKHEKPFLLQPIWKTIGKSAILADHCLDIFVWSDFALTRLFMDPALSTNSEIITRQQRAALRLARFLFEVSKKGKVHQAPIYDGMTYDKSNDVEFKVSGREANLLMKCSRLTKPLMHKGSLNNIILGDGQQLLKPTYDFDAVVSLSLYLNN